MAAAAPAKLPGEEAAVLMRLLSDKERHMAIGQGVLDGKVLDLRPRLNTSAARRQFDEDDCA